MDNQKMNNNRPDQDPEGGNNKKDDMNKKSLLVMVVLAIAVMIIAQMLSGKIASASQKEVTYTEFMQDVKDGKVTKVELDSDRIYYEVKNQKNVKYYTGNVQDERLYEELDNAGVTYSRKVIDTTTYVMSSILSFVLPTVLMVAVMMIFYRFAFKGGGGVMGVGKSNAKLYVQDKTGVTFQDVAGQEESKESLREIVDFLHNPEKYTKIGAKLPKGALLVGPPGTGKTLLAKAVAGEAGVPFFSLSGSDFVEMFVGVGASRVRDLFKQAQQNAPCIIFIDELDAIGKSRDSRFGGNDEREQTLNQLLAEMDGFDSSKGIIILAATNRPEILDKALLRPGRFDRRIIVERPDLKGRIDVLKVHAKKPLILKRLHWQQAEPLALIWPILSMKQHCWLFVMDVMQYLSRIFLNPWKWLLPARPKRTVYSVPKNAELFLIMKSDMHWWLPFRRTQSRYRKSRSSRVQWVHWDM